MLKRATRLLIIGVAAASLNISPALAQMQEIQGIVVTNKDGQLTVKTPQGDQTIALSPSARIRSVSGAFGGQKDVVPPSALIPGLPVVLEVDSSSGRAVAMDVEYKAKDYKTAAQIQAGVQETARREAELRTAYSRMGDWDIRAEETLYFKTGSAVISAADKQKLIHLATNASTMKGYAISVLGYADPTGNAAANEKLSNRRAQTVINYLKQSGKVLPGRVLGASAMGEMHIPTNAPDTNAAYQSARRVTVRVLTSAAHLER
jgi:outer membrane protein OmpA-like peptidoglycan-associated protein